jgi:hypothetical protein
MPSLTVDHVPCMPCTAQSLTHHTPSLTFDTYQACPALRSHSHTTRHHSHLTLTWHALYCAVTHTPHTITHMITPTTHQACPVLCSCRHTTRHLNLTINRHALFCAVTHTPPPPATSPPPPTRAPRQDSHLSLTRHALYCAVTHTPHVTRI